MNDCSLNNLMPSLQNCNSSIVGSGGFSMFSQNVLASSFSKVKIKSIGLATTKLSSMYRCKPIMPLTPNLGVLLYCI